MSTALDRFRKPAYTGENRCLPCTGVNVAIGAAAAAVLAVVATPAVGAAAFVVSLAAIWLRGYLVPGTPELTKRYLPEPVLAWFGKDERPTEETPTVDDPAALQNPEQVLLLTEAVRETDDGTDIELVPAFETAWTEAARDLREDRDPQVAELAGLFEVAPDTAVVHDEIHGPGLYADGERLHDWPSEGAMLADASAQRVLADRAGWRDVPPEQRVGICRALRSFLSTCPVCDGQVALTEDTVESCCQYWDVLAVRCADCETHFLEIDPQSAGIDAETTVSNEKGPSPVSGGFTR